MAKGNVEECGLVTYRFVVEDVQRAIAFIDREEVAHNIVAEMR